MPDEIDDALAVGAAVDIVAEEVEFIVGRESDFGDQCLEGEATTMKIRDGKFSQIIDFCRDVALQRLNAAVCGNIQERLQRLNAVVCKDTPQRLHTYFMVQ